MHHWSIIESISLSPLHLDPFKNPNVAIIATVFGLAGEIIPPAYPTI